MGRDNAVRKSSNSIVRRRAGLVAVLIAVATVLDLQQSAQTAAAASADAAAPSLPQLLSQTGFFDDESAGRPHSSLLAFTPQYPLWSDAAAKRRWLELPSGQFIDATNPGAWAFPPRTRLWKEFSVAGRPVETRMIERLDDGSWRYATYIWNADGSDAVLAPAETALSLPVPGAPNGRYTVPSAYDCRACHEGTAVPVLGFSALQLSGDRDPQAPHAEPGEIDLRALAAAGIVRNLDAALLEAPPRIAAASPAERAALGYLHGNCGHCHSVPDPTGASVPVDVLLAQDVADPGSARRVLRSLLSAASRFRPHGSSGEARLVVPGDSDASMLVYRMQSRDPRVQMPPLGTAVPDSEALALIERWINQELQPAQEPRP